MTPRAAESLGSSLTLREAAERIGVGYSTLRRWVDEGQGPRTFRGPTAVRGRRVIRIYEKELIAWIDRHSSGGGQVR